MRLGAPWEAWAYGEQVDGEARQAEVGEGVATDPGVAYVEDVEGVPQDDCGHCSDAEHGPPPGHGKTASPGCGRAVANGLQFPYSGGWLSSDAPCSRATSARASLLHESKRLLLILSTIWYWSWM